MGAEQSPAQLCGNLLLGGFQGDTLPSAMRDALQAGQRAGVVLFKRNLPSLEATLSLNRELEQACSAGALPLIAVDEEGGRVQRLPPPALRIPPMRKLAERGDASLFERLGHAVGVQLGALGFNLNFAPLLDVDSNPHNPIIGDRAFGSDPARVIECARAYLAGLAAAGVLGCVKHFPGHGDTNQDSHLELPQVNTDREGLERVELAPFRALMPEAPSAMTAHVVYAGLDAGVPASKSATICTTLLRDELGFAGVLFSDDLEMKALSAHDSVEHNAVACIAAGCDALLICEDLELQQRAHAALVREVEHSAAFRQRCEQAAVRVGKLRSGLTSKLVSAAQLPELWQDPLLQSLRAELDAIPS